jgi:tetratricopeptide (TPR) repeat protein
MAKNSVTRLKNMSKIKNKFALVLILLIFPLRADDLSTNPEKIHQFANFLFEQEDYLRAAIEYERYLFLTDQQNDTILFKTGLCHQFRQRYDYAVQSFDRILDNQNSALTQTARLAVLYNYAQQQNWSAIRARGFQNDDEFFYYYLASLKIDSVRWDAALFEKVRDDSLRTALMAIENQKQQITSKSPIVAALLSTIFPGLGKVYIKRPGDAVFAGFMTSFAAIVTWRAFESNLLVTGVITSGITLSFYLGTIYGSYIGTQLYNESLHEKLAGQLEKLNPVLKNPYWLKWQKK